MTILEIQNQIVADFKNLATWEERYKRIIEMGKTLPAYPEEFRLEQFKVKGCQSQVWLYAKANEEKVDYVVDSDALIVKGLAAILHKVFSGQSAKDIAAAPLDFLQEIGLTQHLSQSRSNGLAAMVRQIKNYALVFASLKKS